MRIIIFRQNTELSINYERKMHETKKNSKTMNNRKINWTLYQFIFNVKNMLKKPQYFHVVSTRAYNFTFFLLFLLSLLWCESLVCFQEWSQHTRIFFVAICFPLSVSKRFTLEFASSLKRDFTICRHRLPWAIWISCRSFGNFDFWATRILPRNVLKWIWLF